jgi:RimJ/RimL family protein N-acetyltransferase
MIVLETKRLILRTFKESDCDVMTLINKDPKVMAYFPSTLDREQTIEFIEKIMNHQKKYGYSPYAVDIKSTQEMIGFVGLLHRTKEEFDAHFMPSTEIGWRLSSQHWNQGYATEAASKVRDYAFNSLSLSEIVSFTIPQNRASRRVMEKIGLHHNSQDDFEHPKLAKDSPLSRHVLYRLTKDEYIKQYGEAL